jgi:hypothetical protein
MSRAFFDASTRFLNQMKDKSKSPNQRNIQPKNARVRSGPKTSAPQQITATAQSRTVAPKVYRPQPLPKVLQTKSIARPSNGFPHKETVARTPIAPPVYRPENKKIVQPKIVGATSRPPQAPPVYRPQPMPKVLQTKQSRDTMVTVQKHPTTVPERMLLPHEKRRVVQRKESSVSGHSKVQGKSMTTGGVAPRPAITPVSAPHSGVFRVIQRASRAKAKGKAKPKVKAKPGSEAKAAPAVSWTLEEIADGVTDFAKLEDGEDASAQAQRILEKTVPLSSFVGVKCNCYGWALGENRFYDPGDTLSTWKHRLSGEYTFVDPNAADATIILWGVPLKKADPLKEAKVEDYEVRHASVLLTHEQLRTRKARDFPELKLSEGTFGLIPGSFWSSAMGAGFGIMFHEKDFFENGLFGTAIAGMKKK